MLTGRWTRQIARSDVRTGLRGGMVRIEVRLDGAVYARFQEKYLAIEECQPQPKQQPPIRTKPTPKRPHLRKTLGLCLDAGSQVVRQAYGDGLHLAG